eukprot:975794-Rhodomonas_salina.1
MAAELRLHAQRCAEARAAERREAPQGHLVRRVGGDRGDSLADVGDGPPLDALQVRLRHQRRVLLRGDQRHEAVARAPHYQLCGQRRVTSAVQQTRMRGGWLRTQHSRNLTVAELGPGAAVPSPRKWRVVYGRGGVYSEQGRLQSECDVYERGEQLHSAAPARRVPAGTVGRAPTKAAQRLHSSTALLTTATTLLTAADSAPTRTSAPSSTSAGSSSPTTVTQTHLNEASTTPGWPSQPPLRPRPGVRRFRQQPHPSFSSPLPSQPDTAARTALRLSLIHI